MIAWFRSKRQLIDRNTELAALVAKQIDELATKDEQLAEYDRALTALRASFDRSRIHNRPLVWQQYDAIRQEAAAKRHEDGLGDPE